MVMKSALTVSLTAHQLLPAVSASPDSVLLTNAVVLLNLTKTDYFFCGVVA